MTQPKLLLSAVLLAGASQSWAGPLDEPHLNIVPRTNDETARIAVATAPPKSFDQPQQFEEMSAGSATVRATANANAFSLPSANIGFEGELNFKVGNGLFRKLWVSSPPPLAHLTGLARSTTPDLAKGAT